MTNFTPETWYQTFWMGKPGHFDDVEPATYDYPTRDARRLALIAEANKVTDDDQVKLPDTSTEAAAIERIELDGRTRIRLFQDTVNPIRIGSPTSIWGYSDDVIQLDGAVIDEFQVFSHHDATILDFDNGVRLLVTFDHDGDGMWRIEVIAGGDLVTITKAEERDGWTSAQPKAHTDLAVVTGATVVRMRPASW